MRDRGPDDHIEYEESPSERAMVVGLARIPSHFDPDRYRRMPTDSSSLAWLLGGAGLLVPLLSIAGVLSGYRAAKLGNHLGAVAATRCVVTATISVVLWDSVVGDGASTPSPFTVAVSDVRTDITPPEGLGFASTTPPTHYAALDARIVNTTSEDAPLSPSAFEVWDASNERLAWATTDDTFRATSKLPAGASIEVHIYVALPTGASLAAVSVGDARVDL